MSRLLAGSTESTPVATHGGCHEPAEDHCQCFHVRPWVCGPGYLREGAGGCQGVRRRFHDSGHCRPAWLGGIPGSRCPVLAGEARNCGDGRHGTKTPSCAQRKRAARNLSRDSLQGKERGGAGRFQHPLSGMWPYRPVWEGAAVAEWGSRAALRILGPREGLQRLSALFWPVVQEVGLFLPYKRLLQHLPCRRRAFQQSLPVAMWPGAGTRVATGTTTRQAEIHTARMAGYAGRSAM